MSDPQAINTASAYINNLLLARGLLRHGRKVDFASLLAGASRSNATDRDDTVLETVNLIHDLILRRDRAQDSHESLATTLSTLRSASALQGSQITRLEASNEALRQQLASAHNDVRNAQSAARSADAFAKLLREEASRAKQLANQIRVQCNQDIRRRDMQIAKLKSHLSSAQRGSNAKLANASCTISTRAPNPVTAKLELPNLTDVNYSLEKETTEFLTQLSQGLSEENDALITLLKSTSCALREMMELPEGPVGPGKTQDGMVVQIATSHNVLASEFEFILERLKILLTTEAFAPIAEVYARDGEIAKLREGWEKMESRWIEAMDLMKHWQDRMQNGSGTVGLQELAAGLTLGNGLKTLREVMSPQSLKKLEMQAQGSPIKRLATSGVSMPLDNSSLRAQNHSPLRETSANAPSLTHARSQGEDVENQAQSGKIELRVTIASSKLRRQSVRRSVVAAASAGKDATGESPLQKHISALFSSASPVSSTDGAAGSPTVSPKRMAVSPTPTRKSGRLVGGLSARAATRNSPRLSIDEKLRHAELEAQRVLSKSTVGNDDSDDQGEKHNAEANWGEDEAHVALVPPEVAKVSPQSPKRTKVPDAKAKPGVRTATRSQKATTSRTLTTRVPLKDPDRAPAAKASPSKLRRRQQRKRKSTLSPDELAALMGLKSPSLG